MKSNPLNLVFFSCIDPNYRNGMTLYGLARSLAARDQFLAERKLISCVEISQDQLLEQLDEFLGEQMLNWLYDEFGDAGKQADILDVKCYKGAPVELVPVPLREPRSGAVGHTCVSCFGVRLR